MTSYIAAGIVVFVLGFAHSLIGEMLIFHPLRDEDKKRAALALLGERRWRALWSTWHILTLFGCGLALALFELGGLRLVPGGANGVGGATFLISALFWLYGTRGRHPAWIGLLIVAALIYAAGKA